MTIYNDCDSLGLKLGTSHFLFATPWGAVTISDKDKNNNYSMAFCHAVIGIPEYLVRCITMIL
jgi:hypothetical protein